MGRLTFKELVRKDIRDTFLNPAGFVEEHTVNGKKMPVIIDGNELTEREKRMKSDMDGIYKKQILIYVDAMDYGELPKKGKLVTVDGAKFLVAEGINEGGVYSLLLEADKI